MRTRTLIIAMPLTMLMAGASVATSQTLPTIKRPAAIRNVDASRAEERARLIEIDLDTVPAGKRDSAEKVAQSHRLLASLLRGLMSRDTTWCNDTSPGVHFCGFETDTSRSHIAAKRFWDQMEDGGFAAVKMMNIQGLGDKQGQSVYTELVSDLWNTWRIGIGGVFTTNTDTTKAEAGSASKSRVQQFLNGGGPAVVTLARPLVVINFAGARTVGLFRGQAAFAAPGVDQQSADSTKYSDIGLDLQSQMDGIGGKIGGIATVHLGRVFGGQKFYDGFGTSGSFTVGHYSLGLLIENAVRVSWTRLIVGPSRLIDQSDLITVNVVR